MLSCFVCGANPATARALCTLCQLSLVGEGALDPTSLHSTSGGDGSAWLVDAWGRLFSLSSPTMLGRTQGQILIQVLTVSSRHATLTPCGGRWWVDDLGSHNGTWVNDARVQGAVAISPGDRLRLGPASFYFVEGTPRPEHLIHQGQSTLSMGTLQFQDDASPTPILLHEISGGGVLKVGDRELSLSLLQYELIGGLLKQLVEDAGKGVAVRGYRSSVVLQADLSWDTATPGPGNLKQLVRRTRNRLKPLGLRLEGSQGLGYRLWRSE